LKKFTPVIIAVALALFCRIYIIAMYKVPTQTMAPAILAGDYVMGTQIYNQPEVGDLVVFVKNTRTFIKRVVAAGAEEAGYQNSELHINGKPCEYRQLEGMYDAEFVMFEEICGSNVRRILRPADPAANTFTLTPVKLAAGEYLVASDNRSSDVNSALIETVRTDQIVGKPLVIWMSYATTQDFISKSLGVRWNRILTIPR
jgi:signal peptidase I